MKRLEKARTLYNQVMISSGDILFMQGKTHRYLGIIAIIENTEVKPLTLGISTKEKSACMATNTLLGDLYKQSNVVIWASGTIGWTVV